MRIPVPTTRRASALISRSVALLGELEILYGGAGSGKVCPNLTTTRTAPLDAAVAAAYGWPADFSDDEVLRELLALNGGGP